MKIRIILLLSICWFSQPTNAQSINPETQIKSTITQFFDAMRNVDSSAARKLFYPECTLKTVINKKDGSLSVQHESLGEVLNAIGSPRKEIWDERILSWDIRVDGPFASAWCDYAFYLDQKNAALRN